MVKTVTKMITYEDYYKIDDDKRYEVIKGNLLMVPAPNTEHQHFSRNIEFLIWNYVKENTLGEVYYAPIDVILDKNNIVQPDILYISNNNLEIIKKKGIFGSPDLVIEIISPSSKSRDAYEKKSLYEKFKVKEYWLVDPLNKTVEILKLTNKGHYELYDSGYIEEESESKTMVKSFLLTNLDINLEKIFDKKF